MRCSRILLFAALLFNPLDQVFAADLALKAPPPPPPPTWAGFYIGGTVGGAWGSSNADTSTVVVPGGEFNPVSIATINAAGVQSLRSSGFTGGFEAGYNWQPLGNPLLLGIEADIQAFNLRGNATTGPIAIPGPDSFTITSAVNTDWLATVRGRIGFVAGNWLIYGTGGAAFSRINTNFSLFDAAFNITETASTSGSKNGYTVGGGIEAKLSASWSAKVEYLYVNLGSVSTSGTLGTGVLVITQPFNHTLNLQADIVRVGLNYHFQ